MGGFRLMALTLIDFALGLMVVLVKDEKKQNQEVQLCSLLYMLSILMNIGNYFLGLAPIPLRVRLRSLLY